MYSNVAHIYNEPAQAAEVIKFPTKKRDRTELPRNQTMQALESDEDIDNVILYCLEQGRWRDALLFVFGFNSGLRISDIISRCVDDVMQDGTFVTSCRIVEQKKSNRDVVKPVTIYINQAVKEMLELYFKKAPNLTPHYYLFENYGRGAELVEKNGVMVRPNISRQTAWKIVKNTIAEVGISGRYGTHTLRKTPVWSLIAKPQDEANTIVKNQNGLQAAQLLLNHSSAQSTLHYVGVLEKQLELYYMNLNLGLDAIRKFKERESQ